MSTAPVSSGCVTDDILASATISPEQRRYFCEKGPDQRRIYIAEDCSIGGKKIKKRFQESWFKRFPWMSVSVEKNTVLCFPCILFGNDFSNWRTSGPAGLKQFTCRALRHEKCKNHIENALAMRLFISNKHIEQPMDDDREEEVDEFSKQVVENRQYIQTLIDIVVYLGTHDLVFSDQDEKTDMSYRGNYTDLLMYTANVDPKVKSYVDGNQLFKGTSKNVQNDLKAAVTEVVKLRIKGEIYQATLVSIQIDEVSELFDEEHISIIIRYPVSGVPVERFLGFYPMERMSVENICSTVKSVLSSYDCDLRKLVGASCDGSSVMQGYVNDFVEGMRKLNPAVIFTYSHVHRLHNVISQSVKTDYELKHFFASLDMFRRYFRRSPKRADLLDEFIENSDRKEVRMSTVYENWSSGSCSVSSIIDMHDILVKTLSFIIQDTSFRDESVPLAECLLSKLFEKQFIFLCILWKKIFLKIDALSDVCERIEVDILECCLTVKSCVCNIQNLKFREIFDEIFESMESLCKKSDEIDLSMNHRDPSSEELFLLFTISLEKASASIEERFQDVEQLLPFQACDVTQFRAYTRKFPAQFINDKVKLPIQSEILTNELSVLYKNEFFSGLYVIPSGLLEILINDFSEVFPETIKFLQILVTLGVSSCGCERSLSALKRVKRFSRKCLKDDRLLSQAFISIEKELIASEVKKNSDAWYSDVIHQCSLSQKKRVF